MSIWQNYNLEMKFNTPLCGGTTRNDKLVEDWVRLRAATPAAHERALTHPIGPDGRTPRDIEAVTEEMVATVDPLPETAEKEGVNKVWVGFQRDEYGLFVRGGSIRAHLKDCAQTLGPRMKSSAGFGGLKTLLNFKSKLTQAIYVKEDRVHLCDPTDENRVLTAPHGHRDATLSVMTAMGPRTCLKRIDWCLPVVLSATIQLLPGEIKREHLEMCLEYGQVHGFNQDRSLQYGRYDWTLTE